MKASVPLYHHLKTEILKAIQNHTWTEGELIPSESALSSQYAVSRITVRQAIGDLVSLGYLVRKQGVGTFVAPRGSTIAASRLYGFAEDLRVRGHAVEIEAKSICEVPCPETVSHLLELVPATPVIAISRIARVDGKPVFRDTSYLVVPPQATIADVTRHTELSNHVYGFFEQYGVKIAFGKQQIGADLPTVADVQELHVEPAEPVLVIRRVTSDATGLPVEFSEVRYPAKLYQYEVSLVREVRMGEGQW